jgi:hypothetical protein
LTTRRCCRCQLQPKRQSRVHCCCLLWPRPYQLQQRYAALQAAATVVVAAAAPRPGGSAACVCGCSAMTGLAHQWHWQGRAELRATRQLPIGKPSSGDRSALHSCMTGSPRSRQSGSMPPRGLHAPKPVIQTTTVAITPAVTGNPNNGPGPARGSLSTTRGDID